MFEWSAEGATPDIEATHFIGGISYRFTQDRRAQWYWDDTRWENTSTRRMSLHPFPPTGSWGNQPKSAVMLRASGPGVFKGSVSFEGREPSSSNGVVSLSTRRKATWEFTLTLADP